MTKKLFILFILSFLFLGTSAQSTRFRHLSADDGLSQNTINCFAQDSLGFIWIGTAEGLDRYDGSTIKIYKYDRADSNSLPSNNIKCLLVNKNKLWIGTAGGGLVALDLITGKLKKYPHDPKNKNSISSDYITCLRFSDGKICVATATGGAGSFDPETGIFSPYTFVSGTYVRDINFDHQGNLWFASWGGGVTMYDPHTKKTKIYHADGTPNGIMNERVRAVYADSRGWIWVSCWNNGFNIIEPSTGNIYDSRNGKAMMKNLNLSLISQFKEDSKGNMWLCTAENGAVKYDPNTGERKDFMNDANDMYSISDNTVFNIFEDRSNILWLGTWRGGVNIFDPKTYRFGWFKKDPKDSLSLSNNNVYSLKLAHDGTVWIGTANGICTFDPKTKQFHKLDPPPNTPDALSKNSTIYYIEENTDGKMWFGTSGGGLYCYDPKTKKFKHYNTDTHTNHLSSSSPSVILVGKNNKLYIATYNGGIDLYDPAIDDFTVFQNDSANPNSISGNVVSAMINCPDGKIWVGTNDGGLNLFDPEKGTFKRFLHDPKDSTSILEDNVSSLCLDHHNRLWIGSSIGLCMYDPLLKKFVSYLRLHDFLKQEILSITEDTEGDLWITTRKGICRFSPNDYSTRFYDVSDGLQGNEFLYNGNLYTSDGKLYLGGYNGLNYFSPSEIKDNTVVPDAVITDLTVLNHKYILPQDISYTKEITLKYSDYFFSFHFAAPEFSNVKKNLFKYKLEGFNTDWVDIGNTNSVTFTNLDPGEYTLLVEASNNSGVWNETPTQLKIIITPPFWRTKWFYTLCGLIVTASAYSYIKYREKKLVKEKAELEDKVELRTTELRHEKEKVESAHKDIKDSINYAKRIQDAILPQDEQFASLLPQSFVLFKPKDIVSGDFYWVSNVNETVFYVTADCTGHGVPGGFMTMLGTSLLNEIVNEKNIHEPSKILDLLREKIIAALRQSASGESKDGMDMVVCKIDKAENKLIYAGANNSVYIVRNGILDEFKPDKQPIGFYGEETKPFTQKEIQLQKDDVIYTFTDGYADQFGGEKGKKFKYKQLENLLLSIHSKPMHEQKNILDTAIEKWKEGFEQVDDILVIGVRV